MQDRDHLFLRDITAHPSLSFTGAKGVRRPRILMQHSLVGHPRKNMHVRWNDVRLPESILHFIDL